MGLALNGPAAWAASGPGRVRSAATGGSSGCGLGSSCNRARPAASVPGCCRAPGGARGSSRCGRRGTAAARRAGSPDRRPRRPARHGTGYPTGWGTRRVLTLSRRALKDSPVGSRTAARQRLWTSHRRTPRHSEALRKGCCGYSRYSTGPPLPPAQHAIGAERHSWRGTEYLGDFRPPAVYRVFVALRLFIAHLAALDRPQRDEVQARPCAMANGHG